MDLGYNWIPSSSAMSNAAFSPITNAVLLVLAATFPGAIEI
jgi:hypothetical protein